MTKPWFTWGDALLDRGFVQVPNCLMEYQASLKLSAVEMNLIVQAASFYRQGETLSPSVKRLASQMGLSDRQVRRTKQRLVSSGMLKCQEQNVEGRRTTDTWDFSGLIEKMRTLMVERPDSDVSTPPDKDVKTTPDSDVRTLHTNHTVKEHTRVSRNPFIAQMQKSLGFPDKIDKDPVPNPGMEAKYIKKMQDRGFDWETEIFPLWGAKVAQRCCFVSMRWVNEDIGAKNGAGRQDTAEARAARRQASIGAPITGGKV